MVCMNDCIFCKIINRDVPCHTLYEDDRVIAILDHRPVRPGHALILPRQHIEYFCDLPDDLAAHIVLTGNRLARKMMETLDPKPLCAGHVVHGFIPHVHYHVIPQYDWNDIASAQYARAENGKVIFEAEMIPVANDEEQHRLAQKLRLFSNS
ncbi:MAG: HIT domain-containing protein [Rhodospirillales bacterium]|nr:HIT domain-containing protein [Rhodospirillales bacterium]